MTPPPDDDPFASFLEDAETHAPYPPLQDRDLRMTTPPSPPPLTAAETVNVLLALATYQASQPPAPGDLRAEWASRHLESAIEKLERYHQDLND